jgi:hypothetical protein
MYTSTFKKNPFPTRKKKYIFELEFYLDEY